MAQPENGANGLSNILSRMGEPSKASTGRRSAASELKMKYRSTTVSRGEWIARRASEP